MSLLSKGSPRPAKSSKPRLYTARFDPYSTGIRYLLSKKGIDYEFVYINFQDKPEWLPELNPASQIPIMEIGDEIVSETIVIYDYLEQKFPQVKTQPTDPYLKAKDKIFIDHTREYLTSKITSMIKNPTEENIDYVCSVLKSINKIMGERRTDFLGGSSPNFVDYYLWGWVEQLPALKAVHELKFELDKEIYSHYWAWVMRMDKDEHINKDRETHKLNLKARTAFFKSVINGSPDVNAGM